MEIFELILCILGAVVLSSFISRFIPRISTPLVQIALGVAVTYLPSFPDVKLNPALFMVMFIAPLLYLEAHEIDKPTLYRTLKYSLPMAIGLALGTMVIIGFALHAARPDIPLAAAFALGAALGPTDAVAVSSLSSEATFSKEQKGILQGESLFNDASGVIGFQFAILAAVTGSFSMATATKEFVVSFVGGVVIGLLAGVLANWIFGMARRLGWETMTTRILMELFLPFLVYLAADDLIHVSGILAVVAFGLIVHFDHTGISPNAARTNIVSSSVWSVLSFSLNGTVFILLGMQLPGAMRASWDNHLVSNGVLLSIILLVSLIAIIVRFLWVWLIAAPKRDPDGNRFRRKPRSLRDAAVMTFGGAKGTITLSLMFTIPYNVETGEAFPMRNELIFVASGVIIVTLLLANFMLPLLAPSTDSEETDSKLKAISIEVLRRTVEELSGRVTDENRRVLLPIIDSYNGRITRLRQRMGSIDNAKLEALQIEALHWEKDYVKERLSDLRADETMDKHVKELQIEACERMLDQIMDTLRHTSDKKNNYPAVSQIRGRAHRLRRRIVTLGRRADNKIRRSAPILNDNEVYYYTRSMQIDAINYVIDKLYEAMRENVHPIEYCSLLILDYRRMLAELRSRKGLGRNAGTLAQIDEVKHESFAIELGVIQDMLEDGDITRSQAKYLRRNVYVMQVDAEAEL
ncbi:cation:proton antiporter [Bifidobacterium sp. ESL0763]|uniref:cation:proton antiporter n=1 Tax=Bifidobacterium sp. ESL0763 TaxID=2983227 RepID=UPI0023F6F0A6|nr:cation:proton antiporter [Bifidobacterium sp. ESL0763]MDF7663077.1 cation:proton antiporter [Bifidobacterium sp. ESL0763]